MVVLKYRQYDGLSPGGTSFDCATLIRIFPQPLQPDGIFCSASLPRCIGTALAVPKRLTDEGFSPEVRFCSTCPEKVPQRPQRPKADSVLWKFTARLNPGPSAERHQAQPDFGRPSGSSVPAWLVLTQSSKARSPQPANVLLGPSKMISGPSWPFPRQFKTELISAKDLTLS